MPCKRADTAAILFDKLTVVVTVTVTVTPDDAAADLSKGCSCNSRSRFDAIGRMNVLLLFLGSVIDAKRAV